MTTAAMPTVLITRLDGCCPLQALGTVDRHPFYFRCRGGHWQMAIADEAAADPIDLIWPADGSVSGCKWHGELDTDRHIDEGEAITLIYQHAAQYVAQKAAQQ